ncbi:MAG: diacylglycerol/lipid kinase family protein [Eubacteriales bacterium]
MREVFIVNPKAGGDDPELLAANIRKYYPNADIEYTSAPGKLPQMISSHKGDKVFVVGGDGTFYEAANGACCGEYWKNMQKTPVTAGAPSDEPVKDEDVELCFIPAGSGNDFVRTLYIKEAIRTSYTKVLSASRSFVPRRIDCGKECGDGDKFFLNIGSVGYDAEVVKNSERYKNIPILRKISYILSVFYTLFRFKGIDMTVRIDGKEYKGKKLLAAVANGQYYGGGIRIAPEADMADGMFDVLLIDMIKPIKTLFLLPLLITGAHLKCKPVRFIRAKKVEIECEEEFLLNLDGELFTRRHAVFEICESGLRTLVPSTCVDQQ